MHDLEYAACRRISQYTRLYSVLATVSFAVASFNQAFAANLLVPGQFSTIQAAINSASLGDAVLVSPGTYSENLTLNGVSLRSVAGPASTIISGTGGKAIKMSGAAEVSGFTIVGSQAINSSGIEVNGLGGLIKGNIFRSNYSIDGFGSSIFGNGASPTIDGNLFENNSSPGIGINGVVSFINASSPSITNNIFNKNNSSAINITAPPTAHANIVNNTFVGNWIAIEYSGLSTPTTTFRNNIISGNTTGLLVERSEPIWDHNLVYNNGINYSGMVDPTGTLGNLTADPRLVSSMDFHLLSDSPAIGTGSLVLAPTADFDGNVRPAPLVDIGAYEFVPEPSGIGQVFIALLVVFPPIRRRKSVPHNRV